MGGSGQDAENIINRAAAARSPQKMQELITGLPEGVSIASYVVIPQDIEEVLVANEVHGGADNLRERFVSAIVGAVQASLNHEETKVNVVTEWEVKRRTNLCMDIFREAYHDMQLSAVHINDILADALIQAMIMDYKAQDHIAGTQRQKAWKARAVDERMVDNEPYEAPESTADLEDLSADVRPDFTAEELQED